MSNNLQKSLFRDFFGVGLVKFVSIPLGITLSIVIARYLGPEGFGQYAFVMAVISLISMPLAGGINQLVTREVAGAYVSSNWAIYKGLIRIANMLLAIVSGVIFILVISLFILGYELPENHKQKALTIGLLLVPILGLTAIKSGLLKGLGYPVTSEIPSLLVQPLMLLLFLLLLHWFVPPDPQTVIATQVVSAMISLIAITVLYKSIRPKLCPLMKNRYLLGRWGRSSLSFTLITMISVVNAEIGVIFLSFVGDDSAVAAMRVGERGAQFIALPLVAVNLILGPKIVELYAEKDFSGLQALSKKFSRMALFIAAPAGIVLILFGGSVLNLLFGFEYAHIAYTPMAILVVAQLVNVFFGSVGLLLSMSGHEGEVLRCQIYSVLINGLLCVLLIPHFNAIGSAISSGVAIILWNLMMSLRLKKMLGINSIAI